MKLKILLSGLFTILLFSTTPVLAAGNYGLDKAASKAQYDTSANNNVYSMVQAAINTFLGLFGFVFFGYFMYAGLRWMTARGNEEFITKAKESMSATIYGLIIVLGAYALTNFVFNALNK